MYLLRVLVWIFKDYLQSIASPIAWNIPDYNILVTKEMTPTFKVSTMFHVFGWTQFEVMKQKQTLFGGVIPTENEYKYLPGDNKKHMPRKLPCPFFSLLAISVTLFLVHRRDGLGILALLAYSLFYRPWRTPALITKLEICFITILCRYRILPSFYIL